MSEKGCGQSDLCFVHALAVSSKDETPFSSNYGATAAAVLTEFLSPEEIVAMDSSKLASFICEKSKNSFAETQIVAALLKKAATDSYKLDKCLYEPLTIFIAYHKKFSEVTKHHFCVLATWLVCCPLFLSFNINIPFFAH